MKKELNLPKTDFPQKADSKSIIVFFSKNYNFLNLKRYYNYML